MKYGSSEWEQIEALLAFFQTEQGIEVYRYFISQYQMWRTATTENERRQIKDALEHMIMVSKENDHQYIINTKVNGFSNDGKVFTNLIVSYKASVNVMADEIDINIIPNTRLMHLPKRMEGYLSDLDQPYPQMDLEVMKIRLLRSMPSKQSITKKDIWFKSYADLQEVSQGFSKQYK